MVDLGLRKIKVLRIITWNGVKPTITTHRVIKTAWIIIKYDLKIL